MRGLYGSGVARLRTLEHDRQRLETQHEAAAAHVQRGVRIREYPVAHGTRPMAGGQLRHAERVLAQLIELGMNRSEALYAFHQVGLLVLGLGAQIEATRAEGAQSGLDEWGLLQEAFTTHPDELPVLGELERTELPSLNAAFDELVCFTLAGIARRRGEVLPNQPPAATAP